jgi:hypothetical protein
MYTNYDSSNLNLNLYSRQVGGSCGTECDTDCKQNCKKYCAMTKNDETEQKNQLNKLQDMIKKLKEDIRKLAVSRGGRKKRRTRRGGFFLEGNKDCEEKCEKKCKPNCLELCGETVESFLKEAQKLRDDIAYLKNSEREIRTRRIDKSAILNEKLEAKVEEKLDELRDIRERDYRKYYGYRPIRRSPPITPPLYDKEPPNPANPPKPPNPANPPNPAKPANPNPPKSTFFGF